MWKKAEFYGVVAQAQDMVSKFILLGVTILLNQFMKMCSMRRV